MLGPYEINEIYQNDCIEGLKKTSRELYRPLCFITSL